MSTSGGFTNTCPSYLQAGGRLGKGEVEWREEKGGTGGAAALQPSCSQEQQQQQQAQHDSWPQRRHGATLPRALSPPSTPTVTASWHRPCACCCRQQLLAPPGKPHVARPWSLLAAPPHSPSPLAA